MGVSDDIRLGRARDLIFSTAEKDAAADLCIANMTYGLAKIHMVQESLGHPPDACFVGTPDMTITRNSGRWRAGIGYGGKLSWGDGNRDLLVMDVKPNTCGMLVGGLQERPDVVELTGRLHDLHRSDLELDGVPIKWDFGTGNHFIDIYETAETFTATDLPRYIFVIHASGAELRGESAHGPGLYWDDSGAWERRYQIVETPWGPMHILRGDDLAEYMEVYWKTDDFAIRRREMAARELFGDITLIANINHQGLADPNVILLGCQSTVTEPSTLLPIMVRADRPAFLMEGLPNLTLDKVRELGFEERAENAGVLDRLLNANVMPHGAGYSLPHLSTVRRVIEIDGTRYFELERLNQRDTQIISDPKDLTCGYRDESVVQRTVECGMGRIAARLEPLFVLKS